MLHLLQFAIVILILVAIVARIALDLGRAWPKIVGLAQDHAQARPARDARSGLRTGAALSGGAGIGSAGLAAWRREGEGHRGAQLGHAGRATGCVAAAEEQGDATAVVQCAV